MGDGECPRAPSQTVHARCQDDCKDRPHNPLKLLPVLPLSRRLGKRRGISGQSDKGQWGVMPQTRDLEEKGAATRPGSAEDNSSLRELTPSKGCLHRQQEEGEKRRMVRSQRWVTRPHAASVQRAPLLCRSGIVIRRTRRLAGARRHDRSWALTQGRRGTTSRGGTGWVAGQGPDESTGPAVHMRAGRFFMSVLIPRQIVPIPRQSGAKVRSG